MKLLGVVTFCAILIIVDINFADDQKKLIEDGPDNEAGYDCFDACYPNMSLLTAEGKVRNLQKYGKIVETNGKTFLVGTMRLGSWKHNWKTCCSIGMQPLLLTEKTKILDFRTAIGLSKLEMETLFWTGGFNHEISNTWLWCTKDSPQPIDNDLLKDVLERTESEERCLSIIYGIKYVYTPLQSARLTNKLCTTNETNYRMRTQANLACELIAKKPNDQMIVNSTCMGTRCGINHQCKKNDAIKKFADEGVDLTQMRYGSGEYISACRRYFLFSNESTTYDDAREKCCALGMKLLSVKSAAKRNCLARLTKSYIVSRNNNDISDEFWTSGTDLDCKGNFRWCSVDRAFLRSEVRWATVKPNDKLERCVTIQMSDKETITTLQTADCSENRRYICEVRQTATTVRSIQNECIDLIGLSDDEVDALDNIYMYNYTMKCFLRCVADNLRMIVYGNMHIGYTMRLMRKLDTRREYLYNIIDGKLLMETLDLCNTKLVPNSDACQSTYDMFLCGTSSSLLRDFNKIMSPKFNNYDDNDIERARAIPRTCYKRMKVECEIDPDRKEFFDTMGTTNDGGLSVTGIDWKKWVKSSRNNYTYVDAYNYCCSLGMHQPAATTLDEFMKIRDWMDGANYDNFFGNTYTDPLTNEERWCLTDAVLSPELSDDNFKLDKEHSFLYSPKGSTAPKMRSVRYSKMTSVTVPFIYCQPFSKEESTNN